MRIIICEEQGDFLGEGCDNRLQRKKTTKQSLAFRSVGCRLVLRKLTGTPIEWSPPLTLA